MTSALSPSQSLHSIVQARGSMRLPATRRGTRARRLSTTRSLLLLAAVLVALAGCADEARHRVVLIGGAQSEGLGRHDYPAGIRRLATMLEASPDAARLTVAAYPDGWPGDPEALDGAATIVLYFDGLDAHPLRDPAHRAQFEAAMRAGAGLVALHQASTVPKDDDFDLPRWLGATRDGMFDRTTEWVQASVAQPTHPVARGIGPIAYRDEVYPTLRFTDGARPILTAGLHPQFRDGRSLVDDVAETRSIGWVYERADGGRAFGYSGGHYLSALDEPGVAALLRNAIYWTAHLDVLPSGVAATSLRPLDETSLDSALGAAASSAPASADMPTFHNDRSRSGWRAHETVLTPDVVGGGAFGQLWESPSLDVVDGQPPRLYASPLFVDRVRMLEGQHRGADFPVVVAASSNGIVYAINAKKTGDVAPGRILWRTRLRAPCRLQPAPLDGVPTGILSTPVIDVARQRLYVTHCDPDRRWQAYALELGSGRVLPGWPVRLDEETLNARNANAGPRRVPPRRRFDFRVQRGALNLSPDGSQLYVVFGESETGWVAAVDTRAATVGSAFAASAMPHRGSGGIWGAGGPAVDAEGSVYVVTGTGFDGYVDQPHDWTQSVLKLSPPGAAGFRLQGTYTPFNHCGTAKMDIDLGSGGAMLLADRDPSTTSTPQLMAVGGKQGNVYLLDRSRLPGSLERRPACGNAASRDASLLSPSAQPQFRTRGPLNVFGPYSETDAALDLARARSVPASFRDARGTDYLFVTGSTKAGAGSAVGVAPSLVKLAVVATAGNPAHLRVDRTQPSLVLRNPGSPFVTSNGARDAIVWVLDENASRSAPLLGADAPRPVLYALDAGNLDVLWHSAPGELSTSGKYNEPGFGRGQVFVGTDRIQAFGPGGRAFVGRAPAAAEASARAPAVVAPVASDLDGAAIYRLRCAACHDHPQGNIPPRAVLSRLPRARIVEALSRGAMRTQAQGLSARQIERVAEYVK